MPRAPAASRSPASKVVKVAASTHAPKAPRKSVAAKPAPAPETPPAPVVAKVKHKLVRDSFTIPKSEYVLLEGLKLRASNLKRPIKKSELLRAGVAVLHAMNDKAFLVALNAVPSLKTGRPSKSTHDAKASDK
jgi:hypothetical protein